MFLKPDVPNDLDSLRHTQGSVRRGIGNSTIGSAGVVTIVNGCASGTSSIRSCAPGTLATPVRSRQPALRTVTRWSSSGSRAPGWYVAKTSAKVAVAFDVTTSRVGVPYTVRDAPQHSLKRAHTVGWDLHRHSRTCSPPS